MGVIWLLDLNLKVTTNTYGTQEGSIPHGTDWSHTSKKISIERKAIHCFNSKDATNIFNAIFLHVYDVHTYVHAGLFTCVGTCGKVMLATLHVIY